MGGGWAGPCEGRRRQTVGTSEVWSRPLCVPQFFRILSAFHAKYAEFPLFLASLATARTRLQISIDPGKILENTGFWCILPYPFVWLHKPRVAGSIPAAAIDEKARPNVI